MIICHFWSVQWTTITQKTVINCNLSQLMITPYLVLTLWHPAGFEDSCTKTIGLYVALYTLNSGAESGRELFKAQKTRRVF